MGHVAVNSEVMDVAARTLSYSVVRVVTAVLCMQYNVDLRTVLYTVVLQQQLVYLRYRCSFGGADELHNRIRRQHCKED